MSRGKFKKGDRIVVSDENSAEYGYTGYIKRRSSGFKDRILYVVCFDNRHGWEDGEDGGVGWNIPQDELMLDKDDRIDYEMDA